MAWIPPNQSKAEAVPGGRYVSTGEEAARAFLQRVYLYMSVGLAVTGLVAMAVFSSRAAQEFVFGNPLVFYGLLIAELALVWAFVPVAARVSAGTAAAMFFGYAALSGVTFSVIFLRYTTGSIGGTFVVSGG